MNARRTRLLQAIALQTEAAVPRPDAHAIAELHAFPVREPVSGRSYTVIRLRSRSGLTGHGECGRISQSEVNKARAAVMNRPATSFAVTRTGTALDGAVQTAMVELAAKSVKTPAYRLLGGPTRTKVRVMATLAGSDDDALRRSMEAAHAQGYRAFQVPLPSIGARNQGQTFANEVRRRIELLRAAAAPNTNFVLASDGRLTPGDASRIAAGLERLHLLWFDEPCSTDNLQAIRKITEECVTPLGFGGDVDQPSLFQDLLREGLVDILRPNLHRHGIGGIRQVATLAETYYTAVAPGHDGGPIATAAALQLAASLPNFFIQHVPLPSAEEDRQMRLAIAGNSIETVRDGFLALPAGPGFGIEVNKSALTKYREANG